MPDQNIPRNSVTVRSARQRLHAIAADFSSYSSGELLELKNTTDCTSDLIRAELRQRDARMVDEACSLGDTA